MWKTLRNRVTGDRNSAKSDKRTSNGQTTNSKSMADVVTMATNSRSPQQRKNKTTGGRKKNAPPEDKELKDVLHLFNNLEELILDGDPRVREILEHKPLVQLALNDDGDVTDRSELSPRRPYVPKLALGTARDPSFLREVSGVSGRQIDRKSARPDFGIASPRRDYTLNKFRSENVILQQPIPEHHTVSNTYTIPNTFGKVYRQPDGTVVTTQDNIPQPTVPQRMGNPSAVITQPAFLQANQQEPSGASLEPHQSSFLPERHTFKYDTGQGKSTVEVTMTGDDTVHGFNYTNPEAGYKLNIELDKIPKSEEDVEPPEKAEPPHGASTGHVGRKPITYHRLANGWAEAASKVITASGGEVTCYDCKLEVPKDAVKKSLFRVVILDINLVPYKGVKQAIDDGVPARIPVTPAIRIEPVGMPLEKPITVTMPTCIGSRLFRRKKTVASSLEKDIKASELIVRKRGINDSDWVDHQCDVIHKGSTVVFQIKELADLCVFHNRPVIGDDPLTKRFSIYVFKSLECRKKQFLSLLVCEDQPHVLQKGVESMPGWLHFTDSCVNIRLQEGEDLKVLLQSRDRNLCTIDANKMEIPWENLWKPECIIRKHFYVTMKKVDEDCHVTVSVGDDSITTSFKWQVRYKPIFLPEPIPVENYSLDKEDDLIKLDQVLRQGSNLYKHVNWKPPTPTPPNVTNDTLLKLATM